MRAGGSSPGPGSSPKQPGRTGPGYQYRMAISARQGPISAPPRSFPGRGRPRDTRQVRAMTSPPPFPRVQAASSPVTISSRLSVIPPANENASAAILRLHPLRRPTLFGQRKSSLPPPEELPEEGKASRSRPAPETAQLLRVSWPSRNRRCSRLAASQRRCLTSSAAAAAARVRASGISRISSRILSRLASSLWIFRGPNASRAVTFISVSPISSRREGDQKRCRGTYYQMQTQPQALAEGRHTAQSAGC